MKFLYTIILTALSSMTMQSFAQSPLQSLRQMFSSGAVAIEADYEMNLHEAPIVGASDVIVQGNMYYMKGNGLDVYCNGKSMWTIDDSAMEVVIESCDADDKDYLANPLLILVDLDSLFEIKSQKVVDDCTSYTLVAVADCGVTKATLLLTSKGTIRSAKFQLEDGSTLAVKVSSMKKTEEKPASFFSPQRKFGSDWIVTDLR